MLTKIKENKYLPYIVILIASALISFNFFRLNISEFNEARIHISRITSMKDVILNNIFPWLISSKHMMGFGYGLNIFYGPITTYIPILISFLCGSTIMGLKIFTLLTIILSGITMYNFVLKVSKSKLIALVASLIYITAPYKITNIYSRNAVGEYTALLFIPMVFEGIYEIINGNKKINFLIIVGAVGLILSHTITTIYVVIFSLIYLIINYKKIIDKETIRNIFIDLLLIILLTSFFLIPLLEHKIDGNYCIFDSEAMGATAIDVQRTGLGFKDLLSLEFGNQEIVFSIGIIILFSLILTPFLYKKAKKNNEYDTFLILGIISLLMCTKIFPWFMFPKVLTIVQFAWRLEGFFVFFISYICACNIVTASKLINDKKCILPLSIIVLTLLTGYGVTSRYVSNGDLGKDKNFEKNISTAEKFSPYNINREYLPLRAFASLQYIENREEGAIVLDGNASIENEEKDGLNFSFKVSNVENANIELPYIYYHGYTVKLNDTVIKPQQSENGFLCINLNESGEVKVNYTGTKIEKLGYVISGLTLIGIIVVVLKVKVGNLIENKKNKKG